jgi:hypothetical protein
MRDFLAVKPLVGVVCVASMQQRARWRHGSGRLVPLVLTLRSRGIATTERRTLSQNKTPSARSHGAQLRISNTSPLA